jgi:hypothetical protein
VEIVLTHSDLRQASVSASTETSFGSCLAHAQNAHMENREESDITGCEGLGMSGKSAVVPVEQCPECRSSLGSLPGGRDTTEFGTAPT